MAHIDSRLEPFEHEALLAALRGESERVTSGQALSVVANTETDVPGRLDLLEEVAAARDVADPVRAAALRTLARIDHSRAVELARDLRTPGERLELARVSTIGRLGEPDDLPLLEGLRTREDATGALAVRAGFARTLLIHRFGLSEPVHDRDIEVLPPPGAGPLTFVSSPSAVTRASRVLATAQAELPEFAGNRHEVLDLECDRRTLGLVVRQELRDQSGREQALGRPFVVGVVVTASLEHSTSAVSLLVLSRPDGQGTLRVVVARPTGEQLYSGHGEAQSDGVLSIELAAVRRPGIAAASIRALASDHGVEVFGRLGRAAAEPPRIPYRRPEADLKNPSG